MARAVVISVRFHEGRYHGANDWPPSPARLFQALVAGAARGSAVTEKDAAALRWLEALPPPTIAVPPSRPGQGLRTFVPNNDLDAVGGDPARVGEIRAPKPIRPRHFDAASALVYLWLFEEAPEAEEFADAICDIAGRLYQLGRGVDMAWAQGEVLGTTEAESRLAEQGRSVWRPDRSGAGEALACPRPGSLESLQKRFAAMRERFSGTGTGRKARVLFAQPPKPDFAQIGYNSPSANLLFDIRNSDGTFAPQPLSEVAGQVKVVRDLAVRQLKASAWRQGQATREDQIEKVFIGRDADEADKAQRIRIVPLPSIGHEQVAPDVRRILVVVPPDCPIQAGDIKWAFSGLPIVVDSATGEVDARSPVLVETQDRSMLAHYGIEDGRLARVWRTVTPAALPESAARRRIQPGRRQDAKGGGERQREESAATLAVQRALRHAGVGVAAVSIRVQREPFSARGQRAEAFAPGTRFAKERLWHVEVIFAEPVAGPLIIGDGRYLGLGLMQRVHSDRGVFTFGIVDGLAPGASHEQLTRALRRAVLSRVQEELGPRAATPAFFTGHEADGSAARSGEHVHIAFGYDSMQRLLFVLAPHVLSRRRLWPEEARYLSVLSRALKGLTDLRAGPAGRLTLAPGSHAGTAFEVSRVWESATPYRVNRHVKAGNAALAVAADVRLECEREKLPRPQIDVLETMARRGEGLFGRVRLVFRTPVKGPILLGRDRHLGGGLFVAVEQAFQS